MENNRVAVLNGSIRGSEGNTAALLRRTAGYFPETIEIDEIVLAEYSESVEELAERLRRADALLFGSGVYWGSWGSPLQRFLEIMTGFEASDCFLGKPAGVVVTMDSVGGSDVAQRMLGVLSALGCVIPPLSMVVVSRVGALVQGLAGNEDVWQAEDAQALVHNLMMAVTTKQSGWCTWPMLRIEPVRGPYPGAGIVRQGLERFLTESPDSRAAQDGPEVVSGTPR